MSRIISFTALLIFLLSVSIKTGKVYCQGEKVYSNPILAGFYPDPSICRVSAGYYLVNSTFFYYPGIPVFYSKDIIHREHKSKSIFGPYTSYEKNPILTQKKLSPEREFPTANPGFRLIKNNE